MLKKTKLRLGVVAVLALAGMAFGTVSASADPPAGTYKPVKGSGSDTTQDVVNGLSTVVSAIGNYDAVGSATIKTTAAGPTFTRPNGSTDGVRALSASANPGGTHLWNGVDITDQLDFARSSSGPSSSFVGTDLTYIPFARDAVTYAVNIASDFPRNISLGSAAQDSISPAPFTLRNIYRCTVTSYLDSDLEPVTIRPLIPQAGSGTRSFWLTALGLTEAQVTGCATDLGGTVQEHDGDAVTGAGDIMPYSIAQFLAQENHDLLPTNVVERRSQVVLGRVGSVKPILLTANGNELNTAFPINRLVYNVVETSRLGESAIAATFVGSGSAVCAAGATIRAYGFGTIGSLCGNTTTYKQAFRY